MNYFYSNRFPADLMENPQYYLGPNYKSVLNFYELYYNDKIYLPYKRETEYFRRLNDIVLKIIPEYIASKLNYHQAAFELIAMHILLERGETLQYLPTMIYKNESDS
jgi:hypothetical protein